MPSSGVVGALGELDHISSKRQIGKIHLLFNLYLDSLRSFNGNFVSTGILPWMFAKSIEEKND
jgi:hypothetical protein